MSQSNDGMQKCAQRSDVLGGRSDDGCVERCSAAALPSEAVDRGSSASYSESGPSNDEGNLATNDPQELLRQRIQESFAGSSMIRRLDRELKSFLHEETSGIYLIMPMEYSSLVCGRQGSVIPPPKSLNSNSTEQPSNCIVNGLDLYSIFGRDRLIYSANDSNREMQWRLVIIGAPGTIYEKEAYLLRFMFRPTYPFEFPEVIFMHPHIPIHPHVYSNGHICLSILYDQWSPALCAKSCAVSILSMLSSSRTKSKPIDDSLYCRAAGNRGPRGVRWHFHDDSV